MGPEYTAAVDPAGVTITAPAAVRLTRADLAELIRRIDEERAALHRPAGEGEAR